MEETNANWRINKAPHGKEIARCKEREREREREAEGGTQRSTDLCTGSRFFFCLFSFVFSFISLLSSYLSVFFWCTVGGGFPLGLPTLDPIFARHSNSDVTEFLVVVFFLVTEFSSCAGWHRFFSLRVRLISFSNFIFDTGFSRFDLWCHFEGDITGFCFCFLFWCFVFLFPFRSAPFGSHGAPNLRTSSLPRSLDRILYFGCFFLSFFFRFHFGFDVVVFGYRVVLRLLPRFSSVGFIF